MDLIAVIETVTISVCDLGICAQLFLFGVGEAVAIGICVRALAVDRETDQAAEIRIVFGLHNAIDVLAEDIVVSTACFEHETVKDLELYTDACGDKGCPATELRCRRFLRELLHIVIQAARAGIDEGIPPVSREGAEHKPIIHGNEVGHIVAAAHLPHAYPEFPEESLDQGKAQESTGEELRLVACHIGDSLRDSPPQAHTHALIAQLSESSA